MATSLPFGKARYTGQTRENLRNGYGVYTFSNSFFRYEGEWIDGKMHGHGKFLMKDGSFYEGTFRDGQIYGHGFKFWATTGDKYEGEFSHGEMNGHGIMQFGDGSHYEGYWEDNKREGLGNLTVIDGIQYHGQFHQHKRHGEGNCVYANGDEYDGGWVRDQRHGHGTLKQKDGSVYEGQWNQGVRHGQGEMKHACGVVYVGPWINDRPADEPVALKITTECPIEVHCNDHSISVTVVCVDEDGDVIDNESGRMLTIRAGRQVKQKSSEKLTDLIDTPFGFIVEPYDIRELPILETSSSSVAVPAFGKDSCTSSSANLPEIGVETSSPPPAVVSTVEVVHSTVQSTYTSQVELSAGESSVTAYLDSTTSLLNHATAELETTFLCNLQQVGNVATVNGRATFSRLFIPPLPLPCDMENSHSRQDVIDCVRKGGELSSDDPSKLKFTSSSKESLKQMEPPSPVPSYVRGKGNRNQRKLSSVTSSTSSIKKGESGKLLKKEKDANKHKEINKVEADKYCKTGDYVLLVSDVTNPPFFGSVLKPAFAHIKVLPPPRSRRGTRPKILSASGKGNPQAPSRMELYEK